ncbi:MAG: DUF4258 domain-containing protein [Endozoicomonas sp.]|uniref:DUF4258 domain-containing protein n=1 Tax=Endozoicomonas sp. TaxID=1892382 RepID=UPI003D9AECDB
MNAETKVSIKEFPLKANSALKIVRDLAENHTGSVRFSLHAKERMLERRVSNKQVFDVLKSCRSYVTEHPSQTPKGSWKFTMLGFSSGDVIELVIDLRRPEHDPAAYLVTVIIQ